ncbi:hypothetical protein BT69DRAFT_522179 [Atractiella rhizophila]|nr:hypothetical protein BT69DRAFT_522179 [Atractiella rhizophila]
MEVDIGSAQPGYVGHFTTVMLPSQNSVCRPSFYAPSLATPPRPLSSQATNQRPLLGFVDEIRDDPYTGLTPPARATTPPGVSVSHNKLGKDPGDFASTSRIPLTPGAIPIHITACRNNSETTIGNGIDLNPLSGTSTTRFPLAPPLPIIPLHVGAHQNNSEHTNRDRINVKPPGISPVSFY